MTSLANRPLPARRRRIRHIDRPLQRWLLAVVVFEIAAAAAAVAVLYLRLSALIEGNLYRVHFAAAGSIVPTLLHDGALLLLTFVAANVALLLIATLIWGRYVGSILGAFAAGIDKTGRMDFSADEEGRRRHEILTLSAQWRSKERTRLAAISEQIDKLQSAGDRAAVQDIVRKLRELLR